MRTLLAILLLGSFDCWAYKIGETYDETRGLDTLCTHPNYPPITYRRGEYHFFKYTAKYTPESMMQCFKILATCGDINLNRFVKREENQVVKHGLFEKGFRMRKEFGLEGYSSFTSYFHKKGIYYPYAMKTYILLCFHQYMNKERIRWRYNKRIALYDRKEENKAWKKRLDWVFKPIILEEEPAALKDPVILDPIEEQFYTY